MVRYGGVGVGDVKQSGFVSFFCGGFTSPNDWHFRHEGMDEKVVLDAQ